jgi:hypothetical protein
MSEQTHDGVIAATQLVRGNPTPEELAAVLAVLEAAVPEEQAAASVGVRKTRSTWSRNVGNLRSEIAPGAGQWRAIIRDGLN